MGAALLGALGGGLLSAGGQIGGGILASQGGISAGDAVNISVDPFSQAGTSGVLTDALQLLGRGDINSEPDPVQQIAGRLQGLPIDEKTKRRALIELQQFRAGAPLTYGGTFLDAGISRLGLDREGLQRDVDRSAEFHAKQERLSSQGLDGMNERTLLNRLRAAEAASGALASAGGFATGQTDLSPLQTDLKARDDRQLADLTDRLGVLANFGNINPGQAFEAIIDRELDQNLRLLNESIGISSALTTGLGQGNAIASGAATGQSNAIAGAAQIAAAQAQASNALRNSTSLDNALSIGNAVSNVGGLASAGLGAYLAQRNANTQSAGGSGSGFGFNLNAPNAFSSGFAGGTGTNALSGG